MDTLAGKEAEFAVHINDVKHKVIPVIDDAFAKSVSRHETLDELKESLKQQMQLRAFQQAEEAYHQSLINQAVANSKWIFRRKWSISALMKSNRKLN